jgi:hypothetical protein
MSKHQRACVLVILASLFVPTTFGQSPQPVTGDNIIEVSRFAVQTQLSRPAAELNGAMAGVEVPANSTLVLQDSAYAFSELVLNDKSVLTFASVTDVNITVVKLTLHGRSTIDLTPKVPTPLKPSTPPAKGQALNNPAPQDGPRGTDGTTGGPGTNGIHLKLSVQQLEAVDGSLWVRIDGTPGGPGGDGGGGGKGSSGPHTCVRNPNGGNGGAGGTGGMGGKGGDTAQMHLKIGPNTISPTQAPGVAPSTRPAAANIPGTIVISGAPGGGGPGGQGGGGGDGGEGHENHFPCTASDSSGGAHGPAGASGQAGGIGHFIP